MTELRQIFQPPSRTYESQAINKWQLQDFKSDDYLPLPVSVYLENGEGHAEIIEDVTQAVHAFGFTKILHRSEAPGSFLFHMEVGFKDKNHQQAAHQKRKLAKALLEDGKSLDNTSQESRAVKKVRQSVKRRGKKQTVFVAIGTVLLSTIGSITKDTVKDALKDVIKIEAKKSVRKLDAFMAKELPPAQAQHFHNAVKSLIETSPDRKSDEPSKAR